ncbi:MAG: hypothetical protein H6733_14550 [Alphaproteobacteria bacterium]|nr:hypothetical protein [Alphaproteobacteria bacterium]
MRRVLWCGVAFALAGCTDADGDGFVAGRDCDDADGFVHPGVDEVCDGKDNDCNGQIDEDVAFVAWQDRDGDGFGDPARARRVCTMPDDGVDNSDDCDDLDALSKPGAAEVCDGKDNDCDGTVDEDVTSTFYADADGDGHGVPGDTVTGCYVPDGYSRLDDDCDPDEPAAWTGAPEVCDGIDNDCDRAVDEDLTARLLWADVDGDGYGDPAVRVPGCGTADGVADNARDCDDTDAGVSPDAAELDGNGEDDDCDGFVDEIAVPDHVADLDAALAIAGDGDVIQLAAGIYPGLVDLTGHDVVLAGEGCGRTVLYGDGLGTTLTMDGGTVTALTIAGGSIAGLHVRGPVTGTQLCVEGNANSGWGGGLEVKPGGTLTLEDTLVAGNTAGLDGGGIHVDQGGELTGVRVDVRDNFALYDGGGMVVRSGLATLTASVFAGNSAYDDGGAVILRKQATAGTGGVAVFDHLTFVRNDVQFDAIYPGQDGSLGSAIYAMPETEAYLTNCLFVGHDQIDEQVLFDDFDAIIDATATGYEDNGDRELRRDYDVAGIRGDMDLVYVDPDADPRTWDLRLGPHSVARDAGEAGDRDPDGTRADLGAYGGAEAGPGWNDGYTRDDDGDGLLDPWEVRWGLHPWQDDADLDPDGDGLDNAGEQAARTDPGRPDTDGDGTNDGAEVTAGTDPRLAADHWPVGVVDVPGRALRGTIVTLDASASYDPDGDALSWQWTMTPPAGASGSLSRANEAIAELTVSAEGAWQVGLVVSDGTRQWRGAWTVGVPPMTVVPDDAPTLAAALAGAVSGDTIGLRPGTHRGPITSSLRDLTIVGLGDPDDVVIEAAPNDRVVVWDDHRTLDLRQLTITGGDVTGAGGGIWCRACQAGDVEPECTAGGGPTEPPVVALTDVVVRDNRASTDGGGIWLLGCTLQGARVTVDGNTAHDGGGLYIDQSDVSLVDARLLRNDASRDGGAIYADTLAQSVVITNSVLASNTAADGAALWWHGSTGVVFQGIFDQLVLADNVATASVVQVDRGRLHFFDDLFVGNQGATLLDGGANLFVLYPLFWDNTGALWSDPSIAPPEVWTVAPDVLHRTDDGDPTDDVWTLRPGSALRDGGHPDRRDPDASRAGLGPAGGASAPAFAGLDGVDADGDGMSDGWEVRFGLDRTVDDGGGDLDGDGRTNLAEYQQDKRPDVAD